MADIAQRERRNVIQRRSILFCLFFFSGTAGLVYEILWMRYFHLLFGNTAKAAALVLVVFFLGMAIGSRWGGRLAHRVKTPLIAYGWIELGIALAATPIPFLLPRYEQIYPWISINLGPDPLLLDLVRFPMALGITLPAGILLGATFPVMGAVIVKNHSQMGRDPGLLYGLNTLGGACGIVLTGFILPPLWGISYTYSLAVIINLLIGGIVLLFLKFYTNTEIPLGIESKQRVVKSHVEKPYAIPDRVLLFIAFGSGACTIALEVLWTRMFALVFQNSVYSFSAIVLLALVGLSLGAFLVAVFAKRISNPVGILGLWLGLTGLLTLLTPFIYMQMTGLAYFAYGVGWPSYLFRITALVALVILIPILCAGITLPLIWRLFGTAQPVGTRLGVVNHWNLLGAILGAFGAGFWLISAIGLWKSIGLISIFFLILSQITLFYVSAGPVRRLGWGTALAFVSVALFVSNPLSYSVQRLKQGDELLYLNEAEDAVVSVVKDGEGTRWLKSNNTYNLGATVAVRGEKRLGHLPLLLHPSPEEVVFIGIGTGISMSAGLDHPVEELAGIEILPGALKAIPFFSDYNRNLLANPRVRVVVGDGRVYLKTADRKFDVIVSDLFIPWHAGTGSLYTLEHYEASRERLKPGGIYCQWLPLYQMSEWEFGSISATFLKAFPYVSIWRGDFSTTIPILGLVGSTEPVVLNSGELERRLMELYERMDPKDPLLRNYTDFTLLYGGDLKAIQAWLQPYPLNTQDHPVIEFHAPISQAQKQMFTGKALVSFFRKFQTGPLAEGAVQVRAKNSGQRAALSPLPGYLLFQAVEAGVTQDGQLQLASIKEAVQHLPGSNVLSVLNFVMNSKDPKASRGILLDEVR